MKTDGAAFVVAVGEVATKTTTASAQSRSVNRRPSRRADAASAGGPQITQPNYGVGGGGFASRRPLEPRPLTTTPNVDNYSDKRRPRHTKTAPPTRADDD